jgi:hypothetical protein
MSLRIPSSSTEFVKVPIKVKQDVDPTGFPVAFAFRTTGEPEDPDWKPAEWETSDSEYLARLLVGPDGGEALDEGAYAVWVRVTSNPEKVVRRLGRLIIT